MSDEKTLGQVAYEAHRDFILCGNPGSKFQWHNFTDDVRYAWQAAAEAAVEAVVLGNQRVKYPDKWIHPVTVFGSLEKAFSVLADAKETT